jgi:hypothetical protein
VRELERAVERPEAVFQFGYLRRNMPAEELEHESPIARRG